MCGILTTSSSSASTGHIHSERLSWCSYSRIAGVARRAEAVGAPGLVWLASMTAVCLSRQPLHWNGRVKSAVRHFARYRQRRPVLPGVIGLVFSIQHSRTPHFAPVIGTDIWDQWRGTEATWSEDDNKYKLAGWLRLCPWFSAVYHSTGIGPGTDSFPAAYRRPAVIDSRSWPTGAPVCRWYSAIWVCPTM